MTNTIERLPGEPIILATLPISTHPNVELDRALQELCARLTASTENLWIIVNLNEFQPNFGELAGLLLNDPALLRHRSLEGLVVITSHDLVRLAVKALGQRHAGLYVYAAYSLEDALDWVRSRNAAPV
jgi:hypothetical protein